MTQVLSLAGISSWVQVPIQEEDGGQDEEEEEEEK
jgi:hypothetical protein